MPAKSATKKKAAKAVKKIPAKKAPARKAAPAAKKAPAKKAAPAAKKTAAKRAAAVTPPPALPGGPGIPVRVRMYRQGLGDCFLITFDPGGKEVHMLVDCGSLGATTTGNKLATIVADIHATTGGHVHLVIATHEHQDHVSGFHTRKKDFQKMTADHVWMAWTENPEDGQAQKLQKFKGDLGEAVALAARALTNTKGDEEAASMGLAIRSLLEFAGDPEALGASDDLAKTVDSGMTFVRTGLVTKTGQPVKAQYLEPGGAAQEHAWLPGFRIHVLGPPRLDTRLRELGDHGSEELYGLMAGSGMSSGLQAAAELRAGDAGDATDDPNAVAAQRSEMPFDERFCCSARSPLVRSFLKSYVGDTWRRIDGDWLHSAADLALQLDSLTNNTSLALAIERISDGRVLLFPADAQQGHWLSWHEPPKPFTYTVGGATHTTTAEDLLKRTVFYKAGHHGSHNATAKGKGLEMMKQKDELVAFIPVDRQVALTRNPKDSWQMPAQALYRRLLEQCQGRVARSDIGWADDAENARFPDVEKEFVGLATAKEWKAWRKAQSASSVKVEDLYIDYHLA